MKPPASTRDTIIAVATAPGRGAIGIVRLCGPRAHAIACAVARTSTLVPRHAHYCFFHDTTGAVVDDGIVLYFPAPHSYTGEDVVELQGHGNPVLLEHLLEAGCRLGARPARPGEFTERAFLNDRLTLDQAEAVADLIASPTARAARAARRSLDGAFGAAVTDLVSRVQQMRAALEAAIDFDEEVDGEALANRLLGECVALRDDITRLLLRARQGERLQTGANIAIVGAPNVGKSSLLNRLSGTERAIVTALPGTTRDPLDIDLVIGTLPVRLVDTAGLRETDDVIEVEGIRRTRQAMGRADLVLHVVDRLPPPALDGLPADVPCLIVRNKCDLDAHTPGLAAAATPGPCVHVSALTGAGCDALRRRIEHLAGLPEEAGGEFSARTRHVVALREAADALAGITAGQLEAAPELAAEHLRDATHALEAITGRYDHEALLGDIFARFCIGK